MTAGGVDLEIGQIKLKTASVENIQTGSQSYSSVNVLILSLTWRTQFAFCSTANLKYCRMPFTAAVFVFTTTENIYFQINLIS